MSSAPPPHHSKPSSARHHSNHHQQNHTAKHHHEQRYIPKSTTPTPTPTSSAPKPSPPPPLTTALRTSTVAGGVSGIGGVVDGFVAYLPHDEAVAAGLGGLDAGESQAVVDLLNDSLAALLRAKPREFWRQVAQNTSLHEFLDSYLQFRHRWYDLPHRGPKGTFAGLIVGELELCRRVFMVLYRISSNKDPGASRGDALSMMEHATLLQEIKLLDLPKLLDICAIYGHDNGKLASSLVTNAIIVQPKVLDGINDVIFHFLSILHTMHDRCMSSLQLLTSSGPNDQGYGQLHKDLLEVLDFVNDAIVTLDAFADAYQPAALLFCASFEMSYGVEELLTTLARLHDSLLPSLLQGFKVMSNSVFGNGEASSVFGNGEASSDNRFSDIVLGIRMLSKRTVRFGWRLLDFCYLNDQLKEHDVQASTKMLPAKVEDPMIRGDILVQTLKDINREATYTFHDNPGNTFLQALENEFQLMGRIGDLRSKGWVYIDDEQFQYMSQLTGSTLLSSWNNKPNLIISSHGGEQKQKDEEAAIVESKISQIRDLFPDYGKGFLAACLEAYNQNPEEVIQRILDGTLHEDLLALDASLEQVPQKKPAPVSGKDKGKGILVEPVPHIMNKPPKVDIEMDRVVGDGPSSSISLASQGLSSVSAAPQGRFTRKSNNDLPYSATFDSQNAKDAVRSAVLESQYEYEDEYDDSFDDLGFSVVESSYEETEGSNDAEASSHGPGPRWNSQKKPQFYVKDGKNYSYKVAGSVAVYSTREAAIVRQTQKGTIHGLGRGGNVPIGGFNRQQIDMEGDEEDETPNATENFGRGGNSRGRVGRRGGRNPGNPPEENANPNSAQGLGRGGRRGGRSPGNPPEENENTNSAQGFGRGARRGGWDHDHAPEDDNEDPDVAQGFARGGPTPRGGGGSRGGRNHNRRDRAMKRHLQGMTGL